MDSNRHAARNTQLTRRDALRTLTLTAGGLVAIRARVWGKGTDGRAATSSMAARLSPAQPLCVVRPEQTEGPYFVDEMLNRSDIRSDPSSGLVKEGLPLRLTFRITRAVDSSCSPLPGAVVDVWQCDAEGVYSDVQDPGFNTTGQKFLRGYQTTDAEGTATFLTIYPGWYRGRTAHIHFKIRVGPVSQRGHEFTSQLYFDDAVTDAVHSRPPYAARGRRTVRNEDDGIFRQGGSQLLLNLTEDDAGYSALFHVQLQMEPPPTPTTAQPTQTPVASQAPPTETSVPGGPQPPGGVADRAYLPVSHRR